MLNVYRYGPEDGKTVLALHGITGHGKRWESLATENLADARVLAPDLLGHGRSSANPPWHFESQADAVAEVLRAETGEPALVVGHSFGGAVAIYLANRHPELVRALVLLDPAIGLDPSLVLEVATASVAFPDYTDAAEARNEKRGSDWGEIEPRLLEAELTEHLVPTTGSRVGWRVSVPAMAAYYGELAREFMLPPAGLPTVLAQAMKVQPPYVSDAFKSALVERLGDHLSLHEFDCNHMIPLARPADTERIIRELL
ncbi:alpha/beta hydrolase [Antrihabitans cavernicola]|uniref:Alpha/beta hydrolase n=1 Tax=Antrihabitans cavernicola TaxID=2495913 RepID=A0A5A7SHF0_9NOCA|nr:alpha/beta hydrolase [Spelaeibacter cavernicola]KAA0024033.1 alpha/beta hydrolase [Spelaeibacter cavernicola]